MTDRIYTVEELTKIGGKLWEMGDKRRVYFNSLRERAGLELDHYNTGNISHAKLDGEVISNSEARRISGALSEMKIWYDLADGEFHYKFYSQPELAEEIIAKITAELEA